MTTIAASRSLRMMVSDSAITMGSARLPPSAKMWRIKDCIVGISGDILSAEKFVDWLPRRKGLRPKGPYNALLLYRDGRMSWFMNAHREQFLDMDYFAIGSGEPYAQGAFEAMSAMGLPTDPRIAVRAATKFDRMSEEPIRTLRWVKS